MLGMAVGETARERMVPTWAVSTGAESLLATATPDYPARSTFAYRIAFHFLFSNQDVRYRGPPPVGLPSGHSHVYLFPAISPRPTLDRHLRRHPRCSINSPRNRGTARPVAPPTTTRERVI
jgi:hypothetical protein